MILAPKQSAGTLADERIASELLPAFHALQKECVIFSPAQAIKNRYRSHLIHQNFAAERDEVMAPGQPLKLDQGRRHRRFTGNTPAADQIPVCRGSSSGPRALPSDKNR